jgi:S-adenosylmethionine:tRNA ribosyltransferase-isomerase
MLNEETVRFATTMSELNLSDYLYDLPQERIATYPLAQRDLSKLLVYKQGRIEHHVFNELPVYLPKGSLLVFNNTKVISARLKFEKDTGAEIEIFLLSPVLPSPILSQTMTATTTCKWECAIGNVKRWKPGTLLEKKLPDGTALSAKLDDKEKGLVTFEWSFGKTFAEIINESGSTPLPPYLKRNAEPSDRERYQTIYSKMEGAVAAPTAGLHFTAQVFSSLAERGIKNDYVTLHVSAGTFQPIKSENIAGHVMHKEQVIVTRENIDNLINNEFIVPVGTTSMRTIESLFWFGVNILNEGASIKNLNIKQNDPYTLGGSYSKNKSLEAVRDWMTQNNIDTLIGETSIFIKPGYQFRICKALITNFHQPGSTLILLVAAFVGDDWKKIYKEAMENDYRFLSYGDSSLLIPRGNS